MKTIRFDSAGGASGDMILAALVDLGAPLETILSSLRALPVDHFDIKIEKVSDKGIAGKRLTVHVPHEHKERKLADIRAILSSSKLPAPVTDLALRVFQRLAEVEAAIHSRKPEDVHFHEIGAMDSIIDITGSCLALHLLGLEGVSFSPLPVGTGSTSCAHGILPLPVPAVAELLRNHPIRQTEEPFELVTPTGAALLTTWATALPAPANSIPTTIRAIGTGIGHRSLHHSPNMIRALLMESDPTTSSNDTPTDCVILECNLDDMTPEWIGALQEKLLKEGALDVYTTPVFMKKQRPGVLLTALVRQTDRERFATLILAESTTFGLREYPVRRTVLDRSYVEVHTRFGMARVKVGTRNGVIVTRSPEFEDCRKLAEAARIPLRLVYEEVCRKLDPIQ